MPDDSQTKLWLIEPVADPDDLIWQDRPVWAEVVVAAENSALARQAAEQTALSPDWIHIGNESPSRRAGLNDEQLYHVRLLPPERRAGFPQDVRPGEVLAMRQLRPARRA
jgi:hypothetical protein